MHTTEDELYFQQLQTQLVPNLHNLDPQVQYEIVRVLEMIIQPGCDRGTFADIARMGLLEETPLLRAHVWKVLLGVMGVQWSKWAETRAKNCELYTALKEKFCPAEIPETTEIPSLPEFNRQLWTEIALDTKRTHSTINFFQTEITFTKVYINRPTKHTDILTRILYIWGSTNNAVRYVQGMNQILAPLYYLEFQFLESEHWERESQVFAMFSVLMSWVIDMHIKEMDDCETGIMGRMVSLNRYLRVADEDLWLKMEKQGIYPQCYSFRWLALLLAQQFGIYQTIRLWDQILSYPEQSRYFYLYSLCIGILQLRRKTIMSYDFNISLPAIQKLKDIDVDQVIEIGTGLFFRYRGVGIDEEFWRRVGCGKGKGLGLGLEKGKGKAEEIHLSGGKWAYEDILKHASTYISKQLTYFNKQKQ